MRTKRQKERQQREDDQRRVEVDRRKQERTFRQTVTQVAQTLGETEAQAIVQIERIVTCLGADQTLIHLQETQTIEEQGGMMVPDGSRRRTPGGVFFFLVKQRLKEEGRHEEVKTIFTRAQKEQPSVQIPLTDTRRASVSAMADQA